MLAGALAKQYFIYGKLGCRSQRACFPEIQLGPCRIREISSRESPKAVLLRL
jgi:hypothetical protein